MVLIVGDCVEYAYKICPPWAAMKPMKFSDINRKGVKVK